MEKVYDMQVVGAEVYEVLKNVSKEEYDKVPKKIINLFEKYKNHNDEIKIDLSKSFKEQKISQKAKDIIFVISLNYWLTDEERKQVIKKLNENEKKFNEKYNIEKIFEERKAEKTNEETTNKALVKYEEKWYTKIFNKIRTIIPFYKKK